LLLKKKQKKKKNKNKNKNNDFFTIIIKLNFGLFQLQKMKNIEGFLFFINQIENH